MRSKHFYWALGWFNVGLGMLGAVLPLLPTTIFLIIAAWAFAKSSPECHQWLRSHPRFGQLICGWEDQHAMPQRAKRIAWLTLALSYAFTAVVFGPLSMAAVVSGICLTGVALYIAHIPVLENRPKIQNSPDQA